MGGLRDQVVAVTGGADGIGFAIANRLASDGARVAILDLKGAESAANKLDGLGIDIDVSDPVGMEAAFQNVTDHFGRLDIVVNNAGVEGASAPTGEYPVSAFQRVVGVNLCGTFHGLRFGIPHILKSGGGSVVNISSAAAVKGIPTMGPYCATKAAIVSLTRAAAVEYGAQGIRINAILPGATETAILAQTMEANPQVFGALVAQHPIGRVGQPPEIAAAVAFLVSDEAAFITGIALTVDGGFCAA